MLPCYHFYYRINTPCFLIHITHILSSLRRTSAPIQLTIVLGVLRTQDNHPINYATVFWRRLLLIYFVKCFLGVAELTTQLLRLIGILWPPCVESINWVTLTLEDYRDPLQLWVIILS